MSLEVQIADSDHAIGIWESTLIQIWRGALSPWTAGRANEIARGLIVASASPPTSLYIVEPSSPPPIGDVLKPIAEFSRDIVPNMAMSVVVSEGNAFRAAGVRAIGMTLTTVLPHRSLFRFENSVEMAVERLQPHLRAGNTSQALLGAIERLRGRIGQAA